MEKEERWTRPKRERVCALRTGPGCVNYGLFMQWNDKQLPKGTQQFYGPWNNVQVLCCRKKKPKVHNRV